MYYVNQFTANGWTDLVISTSALPGATVVYVGFSEAECAAAIQWELET